MGAKGKTKVTLPVSKADDLSVRLDMPQADFAMLVQMAHRFLAVCDESGEFEGTGPTHPAWERWRVERFIRELDHGETMLENSKAAMKILRRERRKMNRERAALHQDSYNSRDALKEVQAEVDALKEEQTAILDTLERRNREIKRLQTEAAEKEEYILKFHKLSGLTETDVNNA
jgi:hypothetical protein